MAAGIFGLGLGWMLLWVIFEKCIGTGMVFLNMIFCGTWVCKIDVFVWVGLRFGMIFVLHFGHPRSFDRSCQFLIDYLYKTVPNDMSAIPEGCFACRFD